MQQSKIAEIRSSLEVEKNSLERQLAEYGAQDAQSTPTLTIDEGFADSAAATSERSEVLSLIEQLQGNHREIVETLARIDSGEYGKCQRCGREIPIERLEARPTAKLCVACQQEVDSGHQ